MQISELEAELGKVEGQKAIPTRFLRSQQQKQAKLAAESAEVEGMYIITACIVGYRSQHIDRMIYYVSDFTNLFLLNMRSNLYSMK